MKIGDLVRIKGPLDMHNRLGIVVSSFPLKRNSPILGNKAFKVMLSTGKITAIFTTQAEVINENRR